AGEDEVAGVLEGHVARREEAAEPGGRDERDLLDVEDDPVDALRVKALERLVQLGGGLAVDLALDPEQRRRRVDGRGAYLEHGLVPSPQSSGKSNFNAGRGSPRGSPPIFETRRLRVCIQCIS